MADGYAKPMPTITDENREYWASAKAHALRMQRCKACGTFRFPPTTFCTNCLGPESEWAPLSGRGTVYSFVIMHQVYDPAFKDDVPYNVVTVELEEGPRLYANLLDCPKDQIRVGMAVTVAYDDATDEVTLVKFRPV
jgi:uncharacterized OB-fold protein